MQKFTVCRDDSIYLAWPDVARLPDDRLVCIFSECTHHGNRDYTRIMLCTSEDRGRTWSPRRPLSDALRGDPKVDPYWNCARITCLSDGSLVAVADRVAGRHEGMFGEQANFIWTSNDAGETWTGPTRIPVEGIVPDQLVELRHGDRAGTWFCGAHFLTGPDRDHATWNQRYWCSTDRGQTWEGPITVAAVPGLQLCEGSLMELPGGELVCFMRENSGQGLDAFKTVSRDGGRTWGPVVKFPLPGCHRPVAGMLADGRVLITHRYMQGGKGWTGWWTQNFFAALTDLESCLAHERHHAHTRILPLDFDRSPHSDTGYSGWTQFPDGEIIVVNYIVDDAPKAQIRAYSLRPEDFLLG